MRKTRTIVAVTLLATALCADRAVAVAAARATGEAAAPAGGRDRNPAQSGQQTFAQRLTRSLRQVVPSMQLHQTRRDGLAPIDVPGDVRTAQSSGRGVETTPFQFRLPPPAR
jgi:hypothetical protein